MFDQIGSHCATLVAESLLIHADAREDTTVFGITWEAILENRFRGRFREGDGRIQLRVMKKPPF